MKIHKGTPVFLLAALLILSMSVSGCHSASHQVNDPEDSTPPDNSPWLETVSGEPDPEDISQETPPSESGTDLSLDIELVKEQDRIKLGPFYGLLPELSWSPDGRYLAIFGEKNGYGLWLWDQRSQTSRRLVQLLDRSGQRLTSLTFFGWNRDQDALLYAVDGIQSEGQFLGQNGVLVRQVGLDGKDKVLAWLPGEGTFIRSRLFYRESGRLLLHRGRDLWAVDTNNGRYKHVKSDLPVWDGLFWIVPSPTGEKVVYPEPETDLKKPHLVILDIDSDEEVTVGIPDEYAFLPSWSPDGEKLAFLSAEVRGQSFDFQIGEDGPLPPSTKVVVSNKEGRLIMQVIPPGQEKAGAPVWCPDSSRLSFLSAAVIWADEEFPQIKWRRLLRTDMDNLEDLGTVNGDWLTIGGCMPDEHSVLLFNYEAGGGVTAVLQGPGKKVVVLDHDAVDELPTWWQGSLILSRLAGDNGDHLDTQFYLCNPDGKATLLTSGPGWKSGIQISSEGYMAYTNADNQDYPYPLTVVVEPLSS